jgi:hypothetical protein
MVVKLCPVSCGLESTITRSCTCFKIASYSLDIIWFISVVYFWKNNVIKSSWFYKSSRKS